jgi:prepilin-type N-terminal cleavage/methylation domain-containing protein
MKKAFTLVELIVVITILWILSTIWFISLMWYGVTSRDSVRIANLSDLQKSLELRKSEAWEYPEPDNSYSVKYLWKEIWKQGTVGSKTKQHIKFQATEMDPKYTNDYSYSVSSDGKVFEIWTIMEDESNNSFGFLWGNVYASEEKALNFWSISGKFKSVKVNWETHIFSVPSMTLNSFKNSDNSDFWIVVDVPTDNFSVTGESAIPESYISETESTETISFTPRLLYKWANCWVETDQDIVNFIWWLRDSFNSEPYLSNSNYSDIFSDFEKLKINIDDIEELKKLNININDFTELKKLWLKINKQLGCNITTFKTTDIFPTQCWKEWLDFEWVDNWYDIKEDESCLFNYTVSVPYTWVWASAQVKDWEWVWWTKWLHIRFDGTYQSWNFKYRAFSYKSVKFEFDIKTSVIDAGSYIDFYINWFKYKSIVAWDDYSSWYQKYSTDLLPPGPYTFEWKIHRQYWDDTQLWLDNLNFTCIWWGSLCWFSWWFEPGNEWFEFDWYVSMPWIKTKDNTEGIYAMTNPVLPQRTSTSMTYTKTLTTPSRLSFDFKMLDTGTGEMRVYINGIESKFWSDRLPQWDDIEPNYKTYITPLLPVWEHTIEVKVTRQQHYTHRIFVYIDNFRIYCEEWIAWCGMDMSFENSDIPFKWYFTFDWISTDPWPMEQVDLDAWFVNHWNFAMRNPMIPNSSSTYMYYHKDFDEPAKLSFDYNIRQSWSWAKFYIDDVEYKKVWYQTSETWWSWDTFTTPLLTGKHVIKVEVYKYRHTWSWGSNVYLYLDNFRLSCEWVLSIPANALCGIDYSMEPSNQDLYTYGWVTTAPWFITTWSGWTQAIQNPRLKYWETSTVEFDHLIWSNQELVMDLNIWQWSSNRIYLYIDDLLHETWTSSQNMSVFNEYRTGILPSGSRSFKFILDNKNTNYPITMKLDNIRVE